MALSTASNTTVRVVVVGTIVSYLSVPILIRAFRCIFDYVYGSNEQTVSDADAIQVFIKTGERNVPVNLSPKWSIAEVKHHLSKFVGREAEELRIIVAGHELRDDVKVADCDLGESTVIHAVKVIHRPAPLPSVASAAMAVAAALRQPQVHQSMHSSPNLPAQVSFVVYSQIIEGL